MKKVLLALGLLIIVGVCLADPPPPPQPPAWVVFERTGETTGTILWSREPSANVDWYFLAVRPTANRVGPPAYCDPNWTTPGGPVETIDVESPGVLKKDVTGLDPLKDYDAYVAAVRTMYGWDWAALSSWDSPPRPPAFDYPLGVATDLPGGDQTINPTANLNYAANQALDGFPQVNNVNFVPGYSIVLDGIEAAVDIEIYTAYVWGACFHGGFWHYAQNLFEDGINGTILFEDVSFDAKGDVPILLGNEDPTLPVTLSSFTAQLTASSFVTLRWVSESETMLSGYRILRNTSANAAEAAIITPTLINPTNTSLQHIYRYEDYEVEPDNTYYYWLESVEMNNQTTLHGPVNVVVTSEPVPEFPAVSAMGNVYPNPFRTGLASVDVTVKAGDTAMISVYNIMGQVVKSFALNPGTHKVQWDGRDDKGTLCSSGVYFYKLSSPSINQTKKMVIIK